MSKMRLSIRRNRLTETKALKSYVPSLYDNGAVDGSWLELNWRLNGPGLEKTLLGIQAKSSNRGD